MKIYSIWGWRRIHVGVCCHRRRNTTAGSRLRPDCGSSCVLRSAPDVPTVWRRTDGSTADILGGWWSGWPFHDSRDRPRCSNFAL